VNIHHLELFYYVAKHGGISQAVRRMPYGIQQPAVSSQLIQLEETLGVTLFHRRPFRLTPAGVELYAYVEPFFGQMDAVTMKLRGGSIRHVGVGASEIVLRDHLPTVVNSVRHTFPHLKMTLREGYQSQVEAWLDKGEIDIAFTLLEDRSPKTFNHIFIAEIPLMLIVPRRSGVKTAEELWNKDRIDESLVTLPAYEAMCKNFQAGLTKKRIDWFPSIEVSSLKLIETYVVNGYGIGLFLDIPATRLSPELRSLTLPASDFPPVRFGVLWRGKPTPVVDAFIESTRARARELFGRGKTA